MTHPNVDTTRYGEMRQPKDYGSTAPLCYCSYKFTLDYLIHKFRYNWFDLEPNNDRTRYSHYAKFVLDVKCGPECPETKDTTTIEMGDSWWMPYEEASGEEQYGIKAWKSWKRVLEGCCKSTPCALCTGTYSINSNALTFSQGTEAAPWGPGSSNLEYMKPINNSRAEHSIVYSDDPESGETVQDTNPEGEGTPFGVGVETDTHGITGWSSLLKRYVDRGLDIESNICDWVNKKCMTSETP